MIDYQEELEQYQERIDELAKEKRYAELRDLFLPMEPADIALLLEEGKQEQMPLLYRLLPKETAAEVFVELEPESQEMLINGFSNTELTEVLDELYLDDAVDIVEEMPASVVIRILDKATPEMRKSINEILKYPEDSAGSIMNMEFLSQKNILETENHRILVEDTDEGEVLRERVHDLKQLVTAYQLGWIPEARCEDHVW